MAKDIVKQNYRRADKDGFKIVINDQTGECWYPGYCSLARVASIGLEKPIHPEAVKRTVESVLKPVTNLTILEAKVFTSQGVVPVTLIPLNIGSKVILKYNSDLSEKIMNVGHTKFLHLLVDFQSYALVVVTQFPIPLANIPAN